MMTMLLRHLLHVASAGLVLSLAACDSGIDPQSDQPPAMTPGAADAGVPSTPEATSDQQLRTALQPDARTLHVGDSVVLRAWVVTDGERRVASAPQANVTSTDPSVLASVIDVHGRGESVVTLTAVSPGSASVDVRIGDLDESTLEFEILAAEVDPDPDPIDWDPATCCPGASRAASDKNLCYLPPDTPGCPMTGDQGYCDQDDDNDYSTPDDSGWIQGYEEAALHCAGYEPEIDLAKCCPLATRSANDKNFCYIAPDTGGCPMTLDSGYCDQNGDDDYSTPSESGWVIGYGEANTLCE